MTDKVCAFCSDRVLVVDAGRVVEYGEFPAHTVTIAAEPSQRLSIAPFSGPPSKLILDESSAFRRLCLANGAEEYEKLLALTEDSSSI
jgi:hypothetical protein